MNLDRNRLLEIFLTEERVDEYLTADKKAVRKAERERLYSLLKSYPTGCSHTCAVDCYCLGYDYWPVCSNGHFLIIENGKCYDFCSWKKNGCQVCGAASGKANAAKSVANRDVEKHAEAVKRAVNTDDCRYKQKAAVARNRSKRAEAAKIAGCWLLHKNGERQWFDSKSLQDIATYHRAGVNLVNLAEKYGLSSFYVVIQALKLVGCEVNTQLSNFEVGSKPQRKLYRFLSSITECVENYRGAEWMSTGKRKKELDIYLPGSNLAIEVNGVYWHRDNRSGAREKYDACRDNGVQLLQFSDADINTKFELVASMICSKLGLCERVFARQCIIKEVDTATANRFLDEHHVKGAGRAGKSVGLYYNESLVSLLKYTNRKGHVYIERFASLKFVTAVGGLSRLLKRIRCGKRIVTHSYNDYGSGAAYLACGFKQTDETRIGYGYYKRGVYYNRVACQKHKLLEKYPESKGNTERQIALENGFLEYFDSGYRKFELV